MLSAIAFTTRTGWARVTDISRISDLLEDPHILLWATAEAGSLTTDDIRTMSEEFGLHALALEDALKARQRPKLEGYPQHHFIVAHELHPTNGRFEPRQVSIFAGDRFALVIHTGAERVLEEARARLQRPKRVDAALIVHAILDSVVDEYAAAADSLEDEVEALEDHILERPHPHQAGLFALRRRIVALRRFAIPTERMLEQIVGGRADLGARAPEAFRDVHDHTIRINDTLRAVTDVAEAIFDLQRSEQAAHLSDVTKKLSGWAAIIAVPTLIASIYGMNFALVPREGTIEGFWVIIATMAATGITLWWFMRKRRWV